MDAEKVLENAIQDGFREGIKSKLTGYNSELSNVVESAIKAYSAQFRQLLEGAIADSIKDKDFKSEVQSAIRTQLARTLIQRFGGEMEKQVNLLKSDPTTRARITLAIEEIVAQKA